MLSTEPSMLALDKIRIDGDTQPRAEVDTCVVDDYVEALQSRAKFPPIVVFHDNETYWLADGFHRLAAFRRLGRKEIDATVEPGTQQDAQWYSYGANKDHGKRRTHEDISRVVRAALIHPKCQGMSSRALAEHCGVSHETVRKYQAHLDSNCQLLTPGTVRGRDGKTYPASLGKRKAEGPTQVEDNDEEDLPKGTDDVPEEPGVGDQGEDTPSPQRVSKPVRRPVYDMSQRVSLELSLDDPQNTAKALNNAFPREYLERVYEELRTMWSQTSTEGDEDDSK